MSVATEGQIIGALVGVALLLLIDLALSVALVAISALSRVALRRMSTEAGARWDFLEWMQQPHSRHRIAVEILRQLCLAGALVLAGVAAAAAGWPFPLVTGAALASFVGILLIEAVLARAIVAWNPRMALRATAPVVRLACTALFPLVEPLRSLLAWVHSRPGMSDEEREEEQEEEVEALIEVGEREGLLEAEEGEMMRGIVDLDETRVREIMTPRTDIVALPEETPVALARKTILEVGHSRLPVYRGAIDTVIGVLHSRDLFRAWEEGKDQETIAGYLRPVAFVPATSSARDLLAEMRQKAHLSIVVDEYGGIAGLVTLEDLLEEIVGEIRDEHDEEEDPIRQESDGSWIVQAVAHVDELERLFDVEIEPRDFDTVGGLVVYGFGKVPVAGEILETHGLQLEVLEADRRRVQLLRVRPLDEPTGEAS